jgi:hypothetical protein
LSIDFTPTSDDSSENEAKAWELETDNNIDFASCVGSLIYLGMTRADISYAVNKLAKYMLLQQHPGCTTDKNADCTEDISNEHLFSGFWAQYRVLYYNLHGWCC